jgi:dUTP pyrophosphatase
METLKFYKTHPETYSPIFATKQSACFDICFSSAGKSEYKGFSGQNAPITRYFRDTRGFVIMPGDRMMVPTGLILDILEGYSVRVHARSGLSLKQGLVLVNAEGIIDSDYVEELFVLMTNISDNPISINNGDRISQGELVKVEQYVLEETSDKPATKTDRNGGMGSTGVKST